MDIRSDRTHHIGHPPEAVWAAIARVDAFQDWWPWLRRFEADALAVGDRWECTIRPPVPYALHVAVTLDEVEAPTRIGATLSGDIRGTAAVSLEEVPGGCRVRLVSDLAPHGPALRRVARWAPWVSRFGHDWVLDTGLRQFQRRAF